MAPQNVALQEGTQAYLEGGAKVGLVDVNMGEDGDPSEVILFVRDDGENEFTLRLGDTFPVGDQTWKVDRIEEIGGGRLGAAFSEIE
ncbi:hypothetical protein GCM10010402_05900 [Actinomadura luteofluorescens]|uniref:DUF6406 domain-containing protein n=1 Tax=Actinomadura luteofluorescens TaxID=46163 RepID=UPI002164042F|nr:DUF6406 domain-containing protein [Actinomadura glauciflava]